MEALVDIEIIKAELKGIVAAAASKDVAEMDNPDRIPNDQRISDKAKQLVDKYTFRVCRQYDAWHIMTESGYEGDVITAFDFPGDDAITPFIRSLEV